jgi:hypothetical protein
MQSIICGNPCAKTLSGFVFSYLIINNLELFV